MKISLNWLKDYIEIEGIDSKELAHLLTMSGLEVEEYFDQNEIYKDFVVGFVKDKKKHPNADRLSLCVVNDGNSDLQVVCGAPNVDKGQKIIFAPVNSVIPKGNFKLKKAKIRNEESNGMICSEDELNIGDDHDGILVLDDSLKEGTPITEALNLNDVIFDIAITPNRPDALSHFGVARDVAALLNKKVKYPKISETDKKENIENNFTLKIIDTENCPRYSAKIVRDVEIKESPNWLKQKLVNIGLRPINNVVDVTNFILHETGQPIHSFDLDKLRGNTIVVNSTETEIKYTTLDSKERKLPQNTLLINDAEGPIALAGVMGGKDSEVDGDTKNILIESAYFNPSSIRKTSKALQLSTDASYRFERGTDPNITFYAAGRAAELISELSNGKIQNDLIDEYPNRIIEKEIVLRFKQVTRLLGYEIVKEEIKRILTNLEFKIVLEDEETIKVSVPTFRPDIEREVDLIEEIARIYGYENIPIISKISITLNKKIDESSFVGEIRKSANSLGFYEMINNPLLNKDNASLIGKPIFVKNPQNLDMECLRTSLIPGALNVISQNIKHGERDLMLFEIGNIFNKNSEKDIASFDDFTERKKIIFILTGKTFAKEWYTKEKLTDFYNLKGLLKSFEKNISLDNVLNDSYYNDGSNLFELFLQKKYKNEIIGGGGKLKNSILKSFDITQDVYLFEYDLELLNKVVPKSKRFKEPLKYPKIFKDFAFIFDKSVMFEEVQKFIVRKSSSLLNTVRLFDLFEHKSLGENKKSMAFSLEYFSENRTLTEEEVEKDFRNLIDLITKQFNAQLRGN